MRKLIVIAMVTVLLGLGVGCNPMIVTARWGNNTPKETVELRGAHVDRSGTVDPWEDRYWHQYQRWICIGTQNSCSWVNVADSVAPWVLWLRCNIFYPVGFCADPWGSEVYIAMVDLGLA